MSTNDDSIRREDALRADRLTGSDRQVASARPSVAAGWDLPADLDKPPATIPQRADTPVPDALSEEIEAAMARYPERHSAVLPALEAAQRMYGWLSPETMRQVAAVMQVTPAYLSSIASFYDMLDEEPKGRHHVWVCTSVACHMARPQPVHDAIVEAARERDFDDIDIRTFECLGACEMAPMASIDGRYVGPVDPSDAPEIVAALEEGRVPLPGRGLEDEDYMPAFEGDPPPQEEAP